MLGVGRDRLAERWAISTLGLVLGCGGVTTQGAPPTEPFFVAVGANGTILSSADARVWKRESSGVTASLKSVAASQRAFVAVGADGTILSSVNGRSWTARRSGTEQDLEQVTFDGTQFVAVGGDWSDQAVALTSRDGVAWERVEAPPHYSFRAVATARGTIFASAVTMSYDVPMALDHVVLASVLPSTSNRGGWISRDLPRFTDGLTLERDGFAESETFLVGNWNGESTLSRSQDGERWRTDTLPLSDAVALAASSTRVVVLGNSAALSSVDTETWAETTLPITTGRWLQAVCYGRGMFASVGLDGTLLTSGEGQDWAVGDSGVTSDLFDVTFGPRGL